MLRIDYFCPSCQSYCLKLKSPKEVKMYMKYVNMDKEKGNGKDRRYLMECEECRKDILLEEKGDLEKIKMEQEGCEKDNSIRKGSAENLRMDNPEI